jgi:hypothetical protein
MRIHKLNSSIATVIVGLTIITFGFQNCTKARFVIDEAAKQKALGDESVFGTTPGDDGNIAGRGNTPGDDGNLPGARPGDDGSNPKFPGMGNDPNMPRFPGMGNDPMIPGVPKTPGTGDDTAVPGDGSSITVAPNPVCGPSITSGQASLPTSSKVVAVLFKSDNFAGGGATVIQAWDAEPDVTNIRTQLASMKSLSLKLSKTLAAGTYSVVMFDASKVKAPYKYDWGNGANVIAPLQDSIAHFIDMNSTFKIDSSGKQKSVQSMNLLVGKEGDPACATAGSIDPLLIQLKTSTPQSIALTAPEDGVMFDLLGNRLNHKKVQTAWFESSKTENYYLALPNRDGLVLGIDQLFGDATLGPDGKYASQGFAALAKYDDSGDKIISEDDEVFSKLRLWRDDNLDGVAQQSELYSLDEKGVIAIDLRFDRRYRETDKHGNVTKYKSVVIMKDGQYGLVYDLYLRYINR